MLEINRNICRRIVSKCKIGCEDVDWVHVAQGSPVTGSCELHNMHLFCLLHISDPVFITVSYKITIWRVYSNLESDSICSLCRNGSNNLGHCRHLAQALGLGEADLLIVLAVAEKLQPGVYAVVMGDNSVPR
jgi:hypothetical protein